MAESPSCGACFAVFSSAMQTLSINRAPWPGGPVSCRCNMRLDRVASEPLRPVEKSRVAISAAKRLLFEAARSEGAGGERGY